MEVGEARGSGGGEVAEGLEVKDVSTEEVVQGAVGVEVHHKPQLRVTVSCASVERKESA